MRLDFSFLHIMITSSSISISISIIISFTWIAPLLWFALMLDALETSRAINKAKSESPTIKAFGPSATECPIGGAVCSASFENRPRWLLGSRSGVAQQEVEETQTPGAQPSRREARRRRVNARRLLSNLSPQRRSRGIRGSSCAASAKRLPRTVWISVGHIERHSSYFAVVC